MRHELEWSDGFADSFLRKEFVYTERPPLSDWVAWRDANFMTELQRWCYMIDFWMSNGQSMEADGANTTGQDPNCQTNMIDCRPKTVISYEKLSDRATGRQEIAKLAGVMDNQANVPIIVPAARNCVYNEVMLNSQPGWKNNAHRAGPANDDFKFTMTQMLAMKQLFIDMETKYGPDGAWGDDENAAYVVDCMNQYLTEICAEIITVTMGG